MKITVTGLPATQFRKMLIYATLLNTRRLYHLQQRLVETKDRAVPPLQPQITVAICFNNAQELAVIVRNLYNYTSIFTLHCH
ncbi:unnamed protein product [Dracunculus medinensis]|uniref:Transposase n=1 Tax=Dracunculus medinensis TaxID=318479 RepID=A0A0N4U8N0_DRAME|nr:unnamed protein product [Dracunculus medinensis]